MKRLLIQLLIALTVINWFCIVLQFIFLYRLWDAVFVLMGFCGVGGIMTALILGLYIIAERITKE